MGNLLYERQKDNLGTVRAGLLGLTEMTTNPMDWPAFTTDIEAFQRLQEDFEDASLSYIPQSQNGRTDALAKYARTRGHAFSHIDQTRTEGDVSRRIGLYVLHLI